MPIQWLKSIIKARLDLQSRILARNASWMFIANSVSVLSLFVQSVLLGRFLGPEFFGVYVLVTAVVETIQEALNPNADSAVVKYAAEFRGRGQPDHIVAFLKLSFLIVSAGALLAILVVGILAFAAGQYFFQTTGLAIYALLFAACRSITLFDGVSMSLLKVFDRFRFNSILRIVLVTFDMIVVVLLVSFFQPTVEAVLVAMSASLLLSGCVRNIAAVVELRHFLWPYRTGSLRLLKGRSNEIRSFIVSNSLSKTLKTGVTKLDFVLLGTISGSPSAVGVYAIAKKLASSIAVVADPLLTSVYPQLASLVAKGAQTEVRTMLKKTSMGIVMTAVPLWLSLMIFGKTFLIAVYGEAYVAAYWPVLILSVSLFSAYSVFWAVPLLLSLGQASARLRIDFVSALVWIGLILLFVPQLGAVGSAIAYGFSVVLMHSFYVWRGLKTLATNIIPIEKPVSYELI